MIATFIKTKFYPNVTPLQSSIIDKKKKKKVNQQDLDLFLSDMYAFCLQLDSRREESESESHDSEFSSHVGSDTEYIPPQIESSCSDEDVNVVDISSDETVEDLSTHSEEDKDLQTGM